MLNDDQPWILAADRRIRANDLTQWRLPWERAKHGLFLSESGPNPIVAEGVVVGVVFSPGGLHAANAATGERLWRFAIPGFGTGALLVVDEVVYALGSEGPFAVGLRDGELLWRARPSAHGEFSTILIAAAGALIVGDSRGNLFAYELSTGRLRWKRVLSRSKNRWINGKPLVLGDIIIVGSNAGWVYALDASTGNAIWRKRIGPTTFNVGAMLGELAIVHTHRTVYGLAPEDGSIHFEWKSEGRSIRNVTASDIALFVGLIDDEAIPVEGSPDMRYRPDRLVCLKDGKDAWWLEYPPFSGGQVTWSRKTGLLYETTRSGLGITDPANGDRKITVTNFEHKNNLPDESSAPPWITRDRIYLLTVDGSLVSLRHP